VIQRLRYLCAAAFLLAASVTTGAEARQSWPGEMTSSIRGLSVTPAPTSGRALERSLMPAPKGRVEGNAAPLYYQAMLILATLPQEDQRALETLGRADFARMDIGNGTRIITRVQHAFTLVELASGREACDWATPLRERGIGVFVPEAGHLRLIGITLAAKARLEMIQGRRDDALKTIGAGLALARHAARGPTIVQCVMGLFIADRMADQIEAYIQTRGAPSLYWSLVELGDRPVEIDDAIRSERFMLEYEVPSLNEIISGKMSPEGALQALERVLYPERADGVLSRVGWHVAAEAAGQYPAARASLLASGVPSEQIDRWPIAYVTARHHVQRYLELRDELFRWCPLPWWQAQRGMAAAQEQIERAKARGEGASLLEMVPDVAGLARNAARLERRFAMLRIVEALRLHAGANEGKLPSTLDGLKSTPVPLDVATGQMYSYSVEGNTVIVQGPGIEPGGPDQGLNRERIEYRVRFLDPSAKK
jgi:hypothetical protein